MSLVLHLGKYIINSSYPTQNKPIGFPIYTLVITWILYVSQNELTSIVGTQISPNTYIW